MLDVLQEGLNVGRSRTRSSRYIEDNSLLLGAAEGAPIVRYSKKCIPVLQPPVFNEGIDNLLDKIICEF